jgi:hypothetical protein
VLPEATGEGSGDPSNQGDENWVQREFGETVREERGIIKMESSAGMSRLRIICKLWRTELAVQWCGRSEARPNDRLTKSTTINAPHGSATTETTRDHRDKNLQAAAAALEPLCEI